MKPHLNPHRALRLAAPHILKPSALLACLAAALAAAPPQAAWAQADAGSLLRESQQPPRSVPALPEVRAPRVLKDSGMRLRVTRFVVEGAKSIDAAELEAALAGRLNQEWGFAGLQDAADTVAAAYRARGLHATAYLPEQALANGVVRIVVVEGRLGKLLIEVAPGAAPPLALLRDMISQGQQPGTVINVRALARGSRLANEVPGVDAQVSLRAGAKPGETDIIARIGAKPAVSGTLGMDNHDGRATGEVRASVHLQWANALGQGDEWQFTGQVSEGKRYARLAGSWALNAQGLRLQWQATQMRYALAGEFASSGAAGDATTALLALQHPLQRGPQHTLTLTGELEQRALRNDSAAGPLSDKRLQLLNLRLSGERSDDWAGGGAVNGAVTLSLGQLDLSGNAADLAQDAAGPQRDGRFAKLAWQLGRVQRVADNASVWLSAHGQWSDSNLDSSEKFSLGGANGVRAYPALEASGDHGLLVTAEYRQQLREKLQLSLFYDHGRVRRDSRPYDNSPSPSASLKGVGLALEWQMNSSAVARISAAQRVGRNPWATASGNDSDGTQRKPQFWLQLQTRI